MLEACAAKDYEYFALTDHSKALAMTGGMDAEKLARQWGEIDEVVARHDEIRFLRGLTTLAAIEALENAITQLHVLVLAEGQPRE